MKWRDNPTVEWDIDDLRIAFNQLEGALRGVTHRVEELERQLAEKNKEKEDG